MDPTAGEVLTTFLRERGVEFVFSVSGGPINEIYHGSRKAGLRLIHTRHEGAAGFMADGVARLTGVPGVCAVTLGPGVTNTLTPMITAHRANVPVLFLGGQASVSVLHREPGMSVDHLPIVSSVTRWAARVPSAEVISEYLNRAWAAMLTPPRGPVFLEIPSDVLQAVADRSTRPSWETPKLPSPHPDAVAEARSVLRDARRPLLLVGDDAYWEGAVEETRSFVDASQIPFAPMRLARGLLSEDHPRCVGVGYTPANPALRRALTEADCVILLGLHFEFDLDFGINVSDDAKVIQVVSEAGRLGFNRPATIPIWSATKEFLRAIAGTDLVPDIEWIEGVCEEWRSLRNRFREEAQASAPPVHPLRVVEEVSAAVGDDAVLVTSHGNVDFWADAHLQQKGPGLYLRAGQSGALGAEIPYGVAAKLVRPDAPAVVFVGDGAVGYHVVELDTAGRYGAPVLVVVMDDEKWGAIALPQARAYGYEMEMDLVERDWPGLVRSIGGEGARVEDPDDLGRAVKELLASGRPALLQVPVRSVESPYMHYISK